MSTYVDSTKCDFWYDGDAFRAPANTAAPADVFASSLSGWEPFGAIKAGFSLEQPTDTKDFDAWNNRSGAPIYTQVKPPVPLIKFRSAQPRSKAASLTILRGGSIAETSGGSGIFAWTPGTEEFFALIIRVISAISGNKQAYLCKNSKLLNIPNDDMNDDDLAGYDWQIRPNTPTSGLAVQKYTSVNPLA